MYSISYWKLKKKWKSLENYSSYRFEHSHWSRSVEMLCSECCQGLCHNTTHLKANTKVGCVVMAWFHALKESILGSLHTITPTQYWQCQCFNTNWYNTHEIYLSNLPVVRPEHVGLWDNHSDMGRLNVLDNIRYYGILNRNIL